MLADDMIKIMEENKSGLWKKVTGEQAAIHACAGGLAFAAASSTMLEEAHGHIAAIYPEPVQFSGSLGKLVPVITNVGMLNEIERASMAFPVSKGEPHYFNWEG